VSQHGWLIGGISVQMSGRRIRLPCYFTMRIYGAQGGMETGVFFFSRAQVLPVSIIPPIFHSHILFTCHRRYIILATGSVLKYNTAFCHLNFGLRAIFHYCQTLFVRSQMRVFQNTEMEEEARNLASSNSWPYSATVSARICKTNGVKRGNRQHELC
jgi:hypothetical protein